MSTSQQRQAVRAGWNAERVEQLKKLAKDGYSASQIAKQLKLVSRSAVIGKLHRLGLNARGEAATPGTRVARGEKIATPGPPKAPPVPRAPGQSAGLNFQTRKFKVMGGNTVMPEPTPRAPLEVVPQVDEGPGLATPLTLGPHMCKWPIGDPLREGFTHCGRRQVDDGPYCLDHARRAYQPLKKNAPRNGNELARALRRYVA